MVTSPTLAHVLTQPGTIHARCCPTASHPHVSDYLSDRGQSRSRWSQQSRHSAAKGVEGAVQVCPPHSREGESPSSVRDPAAALLSAGCDTSTRPSIGRCGVAPSAERVGRCDVLAAGKVRNVDETRPDHQVRRPRPCRNRVENVECGVEMVSDAARSSRDQALGRRSG